MNRLSTLALVVGCLALFSRGVSIAPSSAFAQEIGETEGLPDEEAADPELGEDTGDTFSEPPGSLPDYDPDEVEPGIDDGNGEDDGDDGLGADEATTRSPAAAPAG